MKILIELFIQYGADVNFVDAYKNCPLHYAIEVKSEPIVSLLLKNGADASFIDIYDRSLLFYAIEKNCLPVIESLIEYGADVNFVVKNVDNKKTEQPLLFIAIETNEVSIVQCLLEHGAFYDFKSEETLKKLMPLLFYGFNNTVLDYLLETKIDVKDLTMDCLNDLIWRDGDNYLKILVKHGFDIELKNADGETLLVKALSSNKTCLILLLIDG